ncbi:MAG TPA: cellulase family glycosylhydrolase, partial [Spirochaetia bacterium]|nr:cellulase family glycosylhydrolase [Spirochaetia bacterium]
MTASGGWLLDDSARRLILHGVNLGGSSKVPTSPNGATHLRPGFYDHRSVSFIDRPFPIRDADSHFKRIREWGLSLVRLLVTWEAVEHAGPKEYDEEYLDFIEAIAAKAADHNLRIVVDFHQDCWSRFSGGDGAPGWTLELIGMDPRLVDETGAAITHQYHTVPYEKMIWSTNARKLAASTMFTLFFAGRDFAPRLLVGGRSVQDFLQEHYLAALKRLTERLGRYPNVIAVDPMNEPLAGFIGQKDLSEVPGEPRIGAIPTPLESMALASGIPQAVSHYGFGATGSRRRGRQLLNPSGKSLWHSDFGCPWLRHGVWDLDEHGRPRLLRPDYFCS